MNNYTEIKGCLIQKALDGEFDIIAHGCNCFCTMSKGIAIDMAKEFYANEMKLEEIEFKGDINKLGCIDYHSITDTGSHLRISNPNDLHVDDVLVTVVNAYTQYNYGKNHTDGISKPLDYEALKLCMRKINHFFAGKHIGLPQIGCGLGGGSWDKVKSILIKELKDMIVTIVIFPSK